MPRIESDLIACSVLHALHVAHDFAMFLDFILSAHVDFMVHLATIVDEEP